MNKFYFQKPIHVQTGFYIYNSAYYVSRDGALLPNTTVSGTITVQPSTEGYIKLYIKDSNTAAIETDKSKLQFNKEIAVQNGVTINDTNNSGIKLTATE